MSSKLWQGPNASEEEDAEDEDNDDDDDSDDDGVQVVIGDLKSGAPGTFAAGKRGGPPPDKKVSKKIGICQNF